MPPGKIHTHTHTHTHTGILLSPKNYEILPFVSTWMDLEGVMLSEINQRQIVYDVAYMWNPKNTTSG